MNLVESAQMPNRAVLSVHTKSETRDKLELLAQASNRSKSSLANEAIEQYITHQEWLVQEIQKGVDAADRGDMVPSGEVENWFRSVGVKS